MQAHYSFPVFELVTRFCPVTLLLLFISEKIQDRRYETFVSSFLICVFTQTKHFLLLLFVQAALISLLRPCGCCCGSLLYSKLNSASAWWITSCVQECFFTARDGEHHIFRMKNSESFQDLLNLKCTSNHKSACRWLFFWPWCFSV